jgi:putative Ca2+/H+ antiporter (TMEM165/GDT1 family)
MFKIFINTFGLIFIAEWGDRSQLATIVLASVNDVGGIILGSIVGHTICTSLAVIGGALVARWISVRVVTVIGGIVFIGFAIAQLAIGYEDPASTIDSL